MQGSVGPRIFVSKKGMIRIHPTDVCTRNLQQKAEIVLLLETPQAVHEIWGRTHNVLPCSAKGTRNGMRNQIPV